MGDSTSSESSSDVWWSSWLSSAKEKSVSALNATKRDLAEFVSVLSSDTKSAVSGATANIKGALHQTDTNEGPTDTPKTKAQSSSDITPAAAAPYDRCKAQLFALQTSSETYLSDPKENVQEFTEWKSEFDVQACQVEISNLLVSCSHVRTLHAQLVPAQVSYEAFWMRYFYKVQLLEKEEERRAELMARASKRSEKQLQWDEETEDIVPIGPIASPLLKLELEGHHHRSGSSSDSFVCVSEETGDRAPSQDAIDGESWVCLSESSQQAHQEGGGDVGGVAEILDVDLDSYSNVGGSAEERPPPPGDEGKAATAPQGEQDSGSSDWENWDD